MYDDSAPTSTNLEYQSWWIPLQEMQFDNLEQPQPIYEWPNHVKAALPTPGTWLTAYRADGDTGEIGVFVSGTGQPLRELEHRLRREQAEFAAELPPGSELETFKRDGIQRFLTRRAATDFPHDDAKRRWLAETLNAYATVFRSRLQKPLASVKAS